mgnify:CR=1 FL=1
MDTMTYLVHKTTGLPKNRIIGMGGALDSARFRTYLSLALQKPSNDIHGMVIGGHGDTTMIPLTRLATYNGISISNLLDKDHLDKVAADTMVGGKTLTGLLGTSAWYAPGAAAAQMVEAIVKDENRIFPCCALLEGEYGLNDIFLGVPVKLGKNGINQLIELQLNESEKALLASSASHVNSVIEVFKGMEI